MQMTCYGGPTCVQCVIPRCVNPALVAMLDHHIVVHIKAPAGRPGWQMVFQMEPGDALEFARLVRESSLEAGIVVPEGPEQLRFACEFFNLSKSRLAGFKLLNHSWCLVPADAGKAADCSTIEGVAVAHNGKRP